MGPEKGQLNIFFDKDAVTTTESLEFLKIVNASIGFANLDFMKEKNRDKYESLKYSFYGFLYSRNVEFAKFVYETFIPKRPFRKEVYIQMIDKLRDRLKEKINEPYVDELLLLLEDFYLRDIDRVNYYSRSELQGRLISEFSYNQVFERRAFNINDFSEWLNLESENRISEISLAKTENSLEYGIKFLLIWGFENHSMLKDLYLLAFDYILAIIKRRRNGDDRSISIPEIPDNMKEMIEQYDKVDYKIDVKSKTMELKLRGRSK